MPNFEARQNYRMTMSVSPLKRGQTICAAPSLATESRSKQREQFDSAVRQKQEAQQQREEQERLQKEQDEQEEIAELRRQSQFRATPIKKYSAVEVGVNVPVKDLTCPVGPNLETYKRAECKKNMFIDNVEY